MSTDRSVLYAVLCLLLTFLSNNRECNGDAFSPSIIHQQSSKPALLHFRNICGSKRSSIFRSSSVLFSANSKNKMSRPEKKALERKRKQARKQGTYANSVASGPAIQDSKKFALHSNNVSELNSNSSSADDVIKAIKRAQKRHDIHDLQVISKFLIEEVDESFGFGFRGSLLARLAVAALHMSNEGAATCAIASRAIELRRTEYRSSMLPMESAAIIRGLLRIHNVTDAMNILHDELAFPIDGAPLNSPENQDKLKYRAYSIASVASRHFYEMEPIAAVEACKMLKEMGPIVRESGLGAEDLNMPWARIIQGAAQCESARRNGSISIEQSDKDIKIPCNLVYSVLNAMTSFPSQNDDETYEALSNALVRRTNFITGAIEMSGCPDADRGEVIFIGRSNVGKSSLVNMVTNRKSLAYTSKRPGKTQQFNFFAVNDKPGKEKEVKYGDFVPGEKDLDSFYILDVPGFGFAKVPEKQRKAWSDFLAEYITNRKTLRVIFHLIDGRHGPIDEDDNIMRQISESKPNSVQYVIVLTKADKNVKGASTGNGGKVSSAILEKVRKVAQGNNVGSAPILLTSAETKLGRDDMWRYMRLAAEA